MTGITEKALKALIAKAQKEGKVLSQADGIVPGLTFTVSKAGTGAWVLRYMIGGVRKEVSIGRYPAWGIAHAREKAKEDARVKREAERVKAKAERDAKKADEKAAKDKAKAEKKAEAEKAKANVPVDTDGKAVKAKVAKAYVAANRKSADRIEAEGGNQASVNALRAEADREEAKLAAE